MKKSKAHSTEELEQMKLINSKEKPKHIAIIMDGNGRWAKKRFLPRTAGHIEGVERVRDVVEASIDLNIPFVTIYAFSTENWKRPKEEVEILMKLLNKYLKKETESLHANGVKINIIGDISELPDSVKSEVKASTEKTKHNNQLTLNIALNYGSRQEIVMAFKDMYNDIEKGIINISDLNEESFKNYLYTKDQPDPDLLIRTSGEKRISNFMLYQIAYSELEFTEVLWPNFKKKEFYEAIIKFQDRNRRYGGI